jgi:hypothetical protein
MSAARSPALIAIVAALMLAACGDDPADTAATETTTMETGATETATTETAITEATPATSAADDVAQPVI